ncbi:MAG TPA: TylF/MycF/NovP-related O-methyltransferase [Thermoleophilaceae bacterium]|nr:TylF/MycF/NovP-related O-methyltransferase [Thermoleophilaceae bacterium]
MSPSVRSTLKRSRTVHSAYKLTRRLPEAPISDWTNLRRTASIFRVLPNTMLSGPRLINAYDAMETIERERIEGAVVECGVWAGGGVGLMASVAKQYQNRRRVFHLFDSFEGLPQPSRKDVDVVDGFGEQHPELAPDDGDESNALVAIGACAAPLDEVHRLFFDVLAIDPQQVVIHKGWFQETVPAASGSIGAVSVLRLDGDWYESTKICLEGLYDNVVKGGFVIIDDYGHFVGCRKAVDEFFESRALDVRLVDIDGEGVYFRKP